jgi:hypothetical protein
VQPEHKELKVRQAPPEQLVPQVLLGQQDLPAQLEHKEQRVQPVQPALLVP